MEEQEQLEVLAERMFVDGRKSVNAVAKALGITWWEARKLKARFMPILDPQKVEPNDAEASSGDDGELWDVTLQVPESRADEIIAQFTPAEKMFAISAVLQERLDAMLSPATDGE